MSQQAVLSMVVIGLAVLATVGLLRWWGRRQPVNDALPAVHILGAYSPLLTWLRFRRWRPVVAAPLAPALAAQPAVEPPAAPPTEQPSADLSAWRSAHVVPPVALLLALLLAVVGQMLLVATPYEPALGLYFYAGAVAVWLVLTRLVSEPPAPRPFVAWPLPRRAPIMGLWFTCLGLWLYALYQVNRDLPTLDRYLLDAAWVASVLIYAGSVFRLDPWVWPGGARLRAWVRAHRQELILITVLLAGAFAVRFINLAYHPYAFVNDEGEVGKEALAILRGARSNFFEAGWSGQPVWSFVPTALSVALLGNTAVAGRLVSVVEGTLAVFFIYMLAREAFGRKTAFLAGALLLGLAWHVHFSRQGVNNVIDSFFASGVLWLTYRALRRGRLTSYLWAGLAGGLTLYTYLGSRLVLAMTVGLVAYVVVAQRNFLRTHFRQLLVYLGGLLVVAGPQLTYFAQHPNEFMGRLNSEGILQNGWLQRQSVELGQSYAALLYDQFSRSTMVYVAQQALGSFYNSPHPYLIAVAAIFFVFGLAVSMRHIFQTRYLLVCGWFWSVIILGSTLTLGPPSSQRLIMTAPAVALFVALGLREIGRLLVRVKLLTPTLTWILAVGLVGLISAQGLAYYFGEYRTGHYYEDPSNDFSYEVAMAMHALGPAYRVFLIGDPSVYSGFADFGYLAPEVEIVDFNTVTPETLAALPHDKGAFFVAIPRRVDDLRLVQQWLPGGAWQESLRRFQAPQWNYFAYQLPPQDFAAP